MKTNMKPFPKLKGKAILAPMSGITDVAFRELCRKYGAALTYTEFVSSSAIVRGNEKTFNIIKTSNSEKPSAVQIFGSNKPEILESAKKLEKSFDIIDINCGCPAPKIIKICAGSELLKSPDKISDIIKSLTSQIKKPITIKARIGIDNKHINILEIAKLAEKAGAAAITIHGRTQKQGYSGKADWDIIKQVKQSKEISIPVIGNGDITSPELFKQRLQESGVDYIMIGRAAIGNPYIFKQINDYLKTGKYKTRPQLEQFQEYLTLAIKYKIPFQQIRTHAIYFTKGLKNSTQLRNQLSKCKTLDELKEIIKII